MQHIRSACENARLVTEDEATVLRLPALRPTPALEDWQSVLHRAADIVEHLGWCRGTLNHGTRHCAVGAIIAAYNKGHVPRPYCLESFLLAQPTVQWIIGKVEIQLQHPDVMDWNDRIANGGKHVATLLRAAAAQD
jgi:hypothetical protein